MHAQPNARRGYCFCNTPLRAQAVGGHAKHPRLVRRGERAHQSLVRFLEEPGDGGKIGTKGAQPLACIESGMTIRRSPADPISIDGLQCLRVAAGAAAVGDGLVERRKVFKCRRLAFESRVAQMLEEPPVGSAPSLWVRFRQPPPRGQRWNASTNNGSSQRGTGIIRCELYVGRLVWNKVRMVKDPDTGKRVSRPNPPMEWQTVEVPDLAILSRELFDAAQRRKAKNKGIHCSKQQAPKRLLSGLLRCAARGGGMSTKGADKTGRVRVRCSTAAESGTCPAPQTFYIDTIEDRVLSALRAEMQSPQKVAEYVKTYTEERTRLAAQRDRERALIERRLGEVNREIKRVVDQIVKGIGDEVILGAKTFELRAERDRLEAELKAAPPQPIALHPGILADYERKLERLQAAIGQGIGEGNVEYGQAIRDLVECVTVRHKAGCPENIEIEITGRLNYLLGEKAFPSRIGRLGGSGGAIHPISPQRIPQELVYLFDVA